MIRRWVCSVWHRADHLKVCRPGGMFVFCQKCGTSFPPLVLDVKRLQFTKPVKRNVVPFQARRRA